MVRKVAAIWQVLPLVMLGAGASFAQTGLGHIPSVVKGTLLSGQAVSLPESLHGKVGVLVVGFSQRSRDEVTNWGRRLGADYFGAPGVDYYELALLAEVPRFLRGYVTRKIKEQVSQHGQMHFLPIGDHEDEWKAAAGYSNPDQAYVLLVDGSGTLLWRMGGPFTAASYAELQRQMAAARLKSR